MEHRHSTESRGGDPLTQKNNTWSEKLGICEKMAEVRVRIRLRDAGVSGSWEAVLRFFLNRSSSLMTNNRAEEVLW